MNYRAISKGEKRILIILEAAEQLLIDSGYHSFSMRKVAKQAGISVGNLQYYFPTKDQLFESLLDRIIQKYIDQIANFKPQPTPKEQFIKIIKWVIKDLKTEHTTILFPELWSIANHDSQISNILDSMYSKFRILIIDIIKNINPNLSDNQAHRLSIFITATIEGHTIFIGYKKPWTKEVENTIDLSIQSFLWLIEQGNIPTDECIKLQWKN